MIPADAADPWIQLTISEGIGPAAARRLLSAFGPPENIFRASAAALREIVTPKQAAALLAPPDPTLLQRSLDWLQQPGNSLLTLADHDYPPALLEIADPPTVLYVKGRRALLAGRALAVVGSRNASAQGEKNAQAFSQALAQGGLTIVSGLALGIDAAAHRGALPSPASTIAVIGTGADIIYPSRNQALARQIAEHGCILSEYPLGTPSIAANFPRRNRIISGLSLGVLVVEAATASGSLITARSAAEQGREVFAIPGSIHSPLARGCHELLRQGATLVESAHDILQSLPGRAALPAQEEPVVLAAMGYDAVAPEDLAGRCGLPLAEIAARLLALELAGQLEILPGGQYRRLC